jgi:protein-L-isoaspartate(D-aspartate) O-methyltransferase
MTRPHSETTSTDGEPDPFAKARERMVERQLRRRGIHDERVLAAMAEVPRERFVPPEARADAYRDGALSIGEGQTISQPWIVACMTSLLELTGDERVLEVGTGSGYGAAVASRCCREVVSIERHPALAERAREVLAELGYTNVEVRVGDGTRGAPERAPFDGISVTATAAGDPPQALFEQLAPHGALVCPVRRAGEEHLMRFRDGGEELVAPVRFVPLVGMELNGEPREA